MNRSKKASMRRGSSNKTKKSDKSSKKSRTLRSGSSGGGNETQLEAVRLDVSESGEEAARAYAKRAGAAMLEAEMRFERPNDAAAWIDFLDNHVSKRFPGGLTLRKEPASKTRTRIYLALPLRDVVLLREIESLFRAQFVDCRAPRTALRNVYLLPRQASSLVEEGRVVQKARRQAGDVRAVQLEAHMYVALQWKRDGQTVPIDEETIQDCFDKVCLF